MAQYRLDSIGALARQMEFTPSETRAAQLAAAEALLHSLDPAKAYPLEFITFKITGYHPKGVAKDLLTGLALQHDLGLLIERVSDTLDVRTNSLSEPVLSIDDVTEKFNVTSKTVQRWRRRGLPARRFLFADGKRRVGFLLSSVDRFFAAHREQVSEGTNFSQLETPERDEILRRARRLAGMCGCCGDEITRRIARKMNRSPLTILHTIRKHDDEDPQRAIFLNAPRAVEANDRTRILRLHRRGVSLKSLARRSGTSRAAVYRVIIEERVARLNKRKVKFIDDPLYHQDDAESQLAQIASQEEIATASVDLRVPRDLPSHIRRLCEAPLLSPSRERGLFLQFNYYKMRFVIARRKLDPQFARRRDLDAMEKQLARAGEMKNEIVAANLRLLVSIARRHLRPGLSLMELISDGTVTLMRAVEGFDVHRGNKFSTYATLALMKGFARSVPQMMANRAAGVVDREIIDVADYRTGRDAEQLADRDQLSQLMQQLETRERDVLRVHYGLDDRGGAATYEQVGQRLGISKERVRQIEQSALAKLRALGKVFS